MSEIFRELQAEADERAARSAFERWMAQRGTPLHLEQTQAYEAFKAGMTHQACMAAVLMWQAQNKAHPPQRKPLDDKQISNRLWEADWPEVMLSDFVRAKLVALVRSVERAHGITEALATVIRQPGALKESKP